MIDGQDAVKRGGERYLPRPSGMEGAEGDREYFAYRERAEFFNATGRTLEGLHGMMFRKEPLIEVPDGMEVYLDNVDGKGSSIRQFINDVTWDCAKVGFGGVLIDAPSGNGESKRDAEMSGLYPYLVFYRAEQIINRHYRTVNRHRVLDLLVLEEFEEVRTTDRFTYDTEKRYRVLELNEDNVYQVTVYDEYQAPLEQYIPIQFGEPMRHIPFVFMPSNMPVMPMMKNIADVNIAWYRKSADLENGGHWTGVPTPYCIGYEPETRYDSNGNEVPVKPFRLGGASIVYFPAGVTQVAYLEFTGSGLSQLREMMSDDEERMAILGARIISAERKGVESAETARIHRAGENSVLATFANEMSDSWEAVLLEYLSWTADVRLDDSAVRLRINTDYDVSDMSAQELTALVSLWQSGGLSKRQLFRNLKEGELVDSGLSFDDMQAEIDEESGAEMRSPGGGIP